jgi:hypothetical protein
MKILCMSIFRPNYVCTYRGGKFADQAVEEQAAY